MEFTHVNYEAEQLVGNDLRFMWFMVTVLSVCLQ